jgi:hypothetical protein
VARTLSPDPALVTSSTGLVLVMADPAPDAVIDQNWNCQPGEACAVRITSEPDA